MECLQNVIGISKDPCECFQIDSTVSLSGLYLDDTTMQRIPLTAAAYDCSDPNFNDFLNRLRTDAAKEVIDLLYQRMTTQLRQVVTDTFFKLPAKISDYSGLLPLKAYHYIKITPKSYRGLYMTLNSISIPNIDTTKELWIIDSDYNQYFFDTIDNFTKTKLILDRDYYIMYEPNTAPKNYKFKCCGKNLVYEKYINITGGSTDDSSILTKQDQYTHNINIEALISCDPFQFLCYIDFETNRWGRVFATTVLLTARKNLLAWILNSGLITNYLTVQDPEQLQNLMNYYSEEIDERLKFMPQVYDFSDCYVCGGITKGSIII
jgi:hypothetical protein